MSCASASFKPLSMEAVLLCRRPWKKSPIAVNGSVAEDEVDEGVVGVNWMRSWPSFEVFNCKLSFWFTAEGGYENTDCEEVVFFKSARFGP